MFTHWRFVGYRTNEEVARIGERGGGETYIPYFKSIK